MAVSPSPSAIFVIRDGGALRGVTIDLGAGVDTLMFNATAGDLSSTTLSSVEILQFEAVSGLGITTLTVDQAAKDAEAAANQAIQEDTAAQAATTMQGADASAAAPVPVAPAEPAHGPAAAH